MRNSSSDSMCSSGSDSIDSSRIMYSSASTYSSGNRAMTVRTAAATAVRTAATVRVPKSGGSGGVSPCACCSGEHERPRARQVGNLVSPCAGRDRIPRQVRPPDNACQGNKQHATRNTQYATRRKISDTPHTAHRKNKQHKPRGGLVGSPLHKKNIELSKAVS